MSASVSNLQDVRGFTRGFLLAMDWAGHPPDSGVTTRVPRLAGEDMESLYRALRVLPGESRRALRTTWAKRDRLRRVDEAVDLHPSWMVEVLRQEPPALFLLALGELDPNLARSVLRELWPAMRPRPDAAVEEVRPLSPPQAGAFRRFLYERWVLLAAPSSSNLPLEPLLRLDGGQIWLLAQEFGRRETEQIGGRLDASHPSLPVRAAFAAGTDENESLGLVGLHLLSTLLAKHPRQYAVHLAQRMALPVAEHFLRWRDEQAGDTAVPPPIGAAAGGRSGAATRGTAGTTAWNASAPAGAAILPPGGGGATKAGTSPPGPSLNTGTADRNGPQRGAGPPEPEVEYRAVRAEEILEKARAMNEETSDTGS